MEAQAVQSMRQKADTASSYLVLCSLTQGEMCVGDLESHVNLSQSALSQHLAKMRMEGLVDTRRQGQQIYYFISDENVLKMLKALHSVFCE